MARQLHHRKSDGKYAVWSTVVDDYVIDWDYKENVKRKWFKHLICEAEEKIERWMNKIDKEVE